MRFNYLYIPLLLLLACGMFLPFPVMAQLYSDVAANDVDQSSITTAASSQIMEGYPDGTFHPDLPVCRSEGAMVMARLLNVAYKGFMVLPAPAENSPQVSGIPIKHWAYPAVRFLADHGMLDANSKTAIISKSPLTRGELLSYYSRFLHAGVTHTPDATARELAEYRLLPDSWELKFDTPVVRRELARLLDNTLNYLIQHAVAEGTISAFEKDESGERWIHLQTPIGVARLCLPARGVAVQGGTEGSLSEGMTVRTVSDSVSIASRGLYFRIRELTILPKTALKSGDSVN